MSDNAVTWVAAIVVLVIGAFLLGVGQGRDTVREKFLTFCTSQNIPYAKCKEEWEKP